MVCIWPNYCEIQTDVTLTKRQTNKQNECSYMFYVIRICKE